MRNLHFSLFWAKKRYNIQSWKKDVRHKMYQKRQNRTAASRHVVSFEVAASMKVIYVRYLHNRTRYKDAICCNICAQNFASCLWCILHIIIFLPFNISLSTCKYAQWRLLFYPSWVTYYWRNTISCATPLMPEIVDLRFSIVRGGHEVTTFQNSMSFTLEKH